MLVLSLQSIRWSVIEWHRFANHPALPPLPREWIPRVDLALAVHTCRSPRVKCAVTAFGEVGGVVVSPLPWPAFHQTRKYSFLIISRKLLDFSPFFLLIFSPLGTADFLMLLELSGDGYSLLCSKQQPPWHNNSLSKIVTSSNGGGGGGVKRRFVL